MNQNNNFIQKLFSWSLLAFCCLGFLGVFATVVNRDWGYIFKKDLYQYDESSNSVVSANATREFFPTMIRTNPLNQTQGIWMEGPNWQHIPPLFAYVPTLFFKIDGHTTIEIKRFSYALVELLTGLLLILGVAWLSKKALATGSAAIAATLWVITPFSQRLITGTAFGASDIVLAFSVTACFIGAIYYLLPEKEARKNYSLTKLMLLGALFSLPILTKNVLGGIPAASYFLLLLIDQKKVNYKVLAASLSFLFCVFAYFGILYFSSPQTFKMEIFVSFQHFQNFEGWARPWNYYITNYLPGEYLGKFTYLYWLSLAGVSLFLIFKKSLGRTSKVLLLVSLAWFVANIIAISILTSKAPNFIFQTYLLSLLFIVYGIILIGESIFDKLTKNKRETLIRLSSWVVVILCLPLIFYVVFKFVFLLKKFHTTRQQPYSYTTEHEKYYGFGEFAQAKGISNKDIFILNSTPDDCWFRYYLLFLTGAEAKTFDEIYNPSANAQTLEIIRKKYQKLYFIIPSDAKISLPPNDKPDSQITFGDFSLLGFTTASLPENFFENWKNSLNKTPDLPIFSAHSSCSWIEKPPFLP